MKDLSKKSILVRSAEAKASKSLNSEPICDDFNQTPPGKSLIFEIQKRNFKENKDLIDRINLSVFKNKEFRPYQKEIIEAVLNKKDTFVCMPTGGGKSLTFQLPALMLKGVSVVVMPLISLITDQARILSELGISYKIVSGAEKLVCGQAIYEEIVSESPVKILFVTPEKLSKSGKLKDLLKNLYNEGLLSQFVIDEAHCVSK